MRNRKILASSPRRAEKFAERLAGLIVYSSFGTSMDAMIFPRCGAVHTFFMRMTIDVIFLDHDGRVVKLVPRLKPWRFAAGGRHACCTVELPAGVIGSSGTNRGDLLDCRFPFAEKSFSSGEKTEA